MGIAGEPGRRLVVTAVNQEEGKWFAMVRFGPPARIKAGGGAAIKVPVTVTDGGDVFLEFTTPGITGAPRVVLKLQSEKVLRGTFRWGGAPKEHDLRLERLAE